MGVFSRGKGPHSLFPNSTTLSFRTAPSTHPPRRRNVGYVRRWVTSKLSSLRRTTPGTRCVKKMSRLLLIRTPPGRENMGARAARGRRAEEETTRRDCEKSRSGGGGSMREPAPPSRARPSRRRARVPARGWRALDQPLGAWGWRAGPGPGARPWGGAQREAAAAAAHSCAPPSFALRPSGRQLIALAAPPRPRQRVQDELPHRLGGSPPKTGGPSARRASASSIDRAAAGPSPLSPRPSPRRPLTSTSHTPLPCIPGQVPPPPGGQDRLPGPPPADHPGQEQVSWAENAGARRLGRREGVLWRRACAPAGPHAVVLNLPDWPAGGQVTTCGCGHRTRPRDGSARWRRTTTTNS